MRLVGEVEDREVEAAVGLEFGGDVAGVGGVDAVGGGKLDALRGRRRRAWQRVAGGALLQQRAAARRSREVLDVQLGDEVAAPWVGR